MLEQGTLADTAQQRCRLCMYMLFKKLRKDMHTDEKSLDYEKQKLATMKNITIDACNYSHMFPCKMPNSKPFNITKAAQIMHPPPSRGYYGLPSTPNITQAQLTYLGPRPLRLALKL